MNITSISLQRLAAKKQGPGIGGNAPELDLIFLPSRYEPSEITWNRTDGKCQNSRRKYLICDSFKILSTLVWLKVKPVKLVNIFNRRRDLYNRPLLAENK